MAASVYTLCNLELSIKETVAQVFSCKFSEISKYTFSTEHLQTSTSGFVS